MPDKINDQGTTEPLLVKANKAGDKDITDQIDIHGYDGVSASLSKCACGQEFEYWEFSVSIYRDEAIPCPNCGRKLYCSIRVMVFEIQGGAE